MAQLNIAKCIVTLNRRLHPTRLFVLCMLCQTYLEGTAKWTSGMPEVAYGRHVLPFPEKGSSSWCAQHGTPRSVVPCDKE